MSQNDSWKVAIGVAVITAIIGPIIVWSVTNRGATSQEQALQATIAALETRIIAKDVNPTPTEPVGNIDATNPASTSLPTNAPIVISTPHPTAIPTPPPTSTLQPPTPTPEPPIGYIPFGDPNNPTVLNPMFGWEPGGAPENAYDLASKSGVLVISSGPRTNVAGDMQNGSILVYPITGNFIVQMQVLAKFKQDAYWESVDLGVRSTDDRTDWVRIGMQTGGGKKTIGLARNANYNWKGYIDSVSYAPDLVYLKIDRNGRLWTFYYSTNGVNWSIIKQDYLWEIKNAAEIFIDLYANDSDIGIIHADISNFAVNKK